MSTVAETTRARDVAALTPREHVVLRGISWATYEAIVADLGDQHVRLIYDRGVLELMSPSTPNERFKMLLGHFVTEVLLGLRIPFEPAGESRWKREAAARGLEADECYFLTARTVAIVGGRPANQPGDPFPDLAIEVDWSDPVIDRAGIYAALGIPELWRFDGERLRIGHLQPDGSYADRPESRFLPVRADEVGDWVHRAEGVIFSDWIVGLREWVLEELVPRREAEGHGRD